MRIIAVAVVAASIVARLSERAHGDRGTNASENSTVQREAGWPPVAAQPQSNVPVQQSFGDARSLTRDEPPLPPESIGGPLAAAPPTEMTLDALESIALANNPTMVQAAARVDAARGRCLQAGLYPNPRAGYVADEIGMAGRAGMQGFAISQEIVRGNKLSLARAAASQEVAQAQQQFEAQRMRVLNDVRTEFFNVLAAQRTMEVNQEIVGLGERGLKAADDLFRAQEVSRVDLLQARVELSTARVAADAARNRYAAAWRRLASVAGAASMQPTALAGNLEAELPELSWDESLQRLLAASPQLAAARASVGRAVWAVRRARAEPIANLDVQASVQHDNESGDDVAGVSVMLPVPIHNKNQGAIRAAEAELQMAQAEVGRLELELQSRLAAAFERYSNARQQVNRYAREILPDARASLELVTNGYRQGEIAYLALLEAQRTVSRANLLYSTALEQLWETTTAIEGLLLTNSLQAPER